MAFKGERFGEFVLEARLGPSREGERWRARGSDGAAALAIFYKDPGWHHLVRVAGLPDGVPEHAALQRILAQDLDAPQPYIVWSAVPDHRLAAPLAAKRALPMVGAIPIALQVARGLEALHKAGVAHHDLRPQSIALEADGRVLLASPQTRAYREAIAQSALEGPGAGGLEDDERAEILRYLPPEAKKDGTVEDGPAADVFQFGVLLHEMVLGEPPDPMDTRFPSQRDRRIPKVVDEVVAGALQRRVRARTPNAIGLPRLLDEGFERTGFRIGPANDPPIGWVYETPWRRGKGSDDEQRDLAALFGGG